MNYGEKNYGEKYAQAMEEFPYSYQTLANAKWVASRVEFSLRNENLLWNHHRAVAPLDPDEQVFFLNMAEENNLTVRELRKAIRDYKLQLKQPPKLEGKYRVVYADPPWRYSDELIDGYGSVEHHYPTMSIEEVWSYRKTSELLQEAEGKTVQDLQLAKALKEYPELEMK